ncbi:MAG: hypothetical protein KDD45_05380, partial [Bdellovibrionales bacterium]|nr:hypothetical protein [Bdellovibrionales bacterium]
KDMMVLLETSSMIAYGENAENVYQPLADCLFKQSADQRLMIQCDSLFSGYLTENESDSFVFSPIILKNGFWETEDFAKFSNDHFQIKGRNKDFVKVKGELTNLLEIKTLLTKILTKKINSLEATVIAIPHKRDENQLILVIGTSNSHKSALTLTNTLNSTIHHLLKELNQMLLPFEKIQHYIIINEIPKTELGKIKYTYFESENFMEYLNENRKNIME